jgi:UDP-N-acetylmuramate--alanine ligase
MNYFFIGIAGTGMSAIAQYLRAAGHEVSGSDRQFQPGIENVSQVALEAEGIQCFLQDGSGITESTDIIVVSTAIEDTVAEVKKAKQLGKPIVKRSELLASIATTKKTIAVGGTSGKSTTTAMLYEILSLAGLEPSIIGGAGLTRLINQGKIGNASYGNGEWLILEADESDGSIVQYHPEIGVLLNVDKDHQDVEKLMELFGVFKSHSNHFVVNLSHPLAAQLSNGSLYDFSIAHSQFTQTGFHISFSYHEDIYEMNVIGKHNMENAIAAISIANMIGVGYNICALALKNYEGIYRRHQIYGVAKGVTLIDDFAHNPVKCARSMEACQPISSKLIAWFQPHGYGPTKFLRNDFVDELSRALRVGDEIWMSEIYYAGGTAVKDISANDLIEDLKAKGMNAYFVEDRHHIVKAMEPHFTHDTTLLLMGARDPSLANFAEEVWKKLGNRQ